MTKINKRLFLGEESDAYVGLTDAILNVAIESNIGNKLNVLAYNKIGLVDGASNQIYPMTAAVLLLDFMVKTYDTTLIHCLAGISRSPTIVATYMAVKHELTLTEAIKAIKGLKPIIDPSPVLLEQAELVLNYLRR